MKRYLLILLVFTCIQQVSGQQKKVVFIIVDGVAADVIEKVATPNLRRIAEKGAFLKAYQGGEKDTYTASPTISAVGYTNILTGTWYNKHNVPDNNIKNPNYNYRTIFRFLKDQYPEKKAAIFSSWQDNRTKLIGENLPQTGHIRLDYHFDGLELDTLKYPHDRGRNYMAQIDQDVAGEAAKYIQQNGPDLSWVYLEYTDDMGHKYGDSEQYYSAVQMEDKLVGQIRDAVQYRRDNNKEDWLVIVTTDHGRDAKTGRNHGGQSDRERSSWIITDAASLNQYAQSQNVNATDILPTIARFMGLNIPESQRRELDGVPLTGPVSVFAPQAVREGNTIRLTWKAAGKEGRLKILLSNTNQFRENGQDDQYKYIAEVPLLQEHYEVDLSKQTPSTFYKIVLEGPDNSVNRWVVK